MLPTSLRGGISTLALASLYLILAAAPLGVAAVKEHDFKKCYQSSFCRRNRALADHYDSIQGHLSPFHIPLDSLSLSPEGLLSATIQDDRAESTNASGFSGPFTPLSLSIHLYPEGACRVRVDEAAPIRPRYDEVKDYIIVRNPEPLISSESATMDKASDGTVTIRWGKDATHTLLLRSAPFSLSLLQDGEEIIQLNSDGLMNFERLRLKPVPVVEDAPADIPAEGIHVQDQNDETIKEEEDSIQEDDPIKEEEAVTAPWKEEEKDMWEESFGGSTDSKPHGPSSIGLDITFPGAAHVYGIPQHAGPLSLKTTRGGEGDTYTDPYRLYNADVFEYLADSPMSIYGSIPIMYAHRHPGRTTGVFWLNAAETWIDITKEGGAEGPTPSPSVRTHWVSESGLLDLFLFPGPTPASILTQYTDLTGRPALPPAFSIAYHQCRWNYVDTADVLQVDAGFDTHAIPYDVIWLDIEHTDGKRYFTWDPLKFPDPLPMQEALGAKGRHLVTIVDPHIKRDDDYSVYKEASDLDHFVHATDAVTPFDGWCWPGSSSWVDYTKDAASAWWRDMFRFSRYLGSSRTLHVWNDMNEPAVFSGPEITMPKDVIHARGWEHRDLHNLFGSLLHKATSEGIRFRESPEGATEGGLRPFVLSRAFYAGSQRWGAIWTGDNSAEWSHLKISIPMLLSINMAGLPFSGADVGGFFGNPDHELLTRWYQAGAFQPFFRAHAHIDTKRREPWLLGDPWTSHIRAAIQARYILLPYWYTLFAEATRTGTPPIRPMFMSFPEDATLWAEEAQYMLGSALLVRPVTDAGQSSMDVTLPGDQPWYDYVTYAKFTPGTHTIDTPMDKIPVYIRGGSIIPTRQRLRRSSAAMANDPFTLLVAQDTQGTAQGELYLDDGETYAHEQGAFSRRLITLRPAKEGKRSLLQSVSAEASGNTSDATQVTPAGIAFADTSAALLIERIVFIGPEDQPKRVLSIEDGQERELQLSCSPERCVIRAPKIGATRDWTLSIEW